MSSYLNFYVKDLIDQYHKIISFSRSSYDIYSLFKEYLVFTDKYTLISEVTLCKVKELIYKDISSYKEEIDFLSKIVVNSSEALEASLNKKLNDQQQIEELEENLNNIQFLCKLVDLCNFGSDFEGVYYTYD